jgi:hypothetical protein
MTTRHKTLIGLLSALVIILSYLGNSISAQAAEANPIDTSTYPILGLTCGNPDGDDTMKKCCVNPILEPGVLNLGPPFDVVGAAINKGLEDKLNPILEMERQIVTDPCVPGSSPTTPGDLTNAACTCIIPSPSPLAAISPMCGRISNPSEVSKCVTCLQGNAGASGVWTSVGCVYSDIGVFIEQKMLGWGVGLAGGISLLCIMYAAFMMQTSRGNAEVIKKAQQLLTSCITGLMLILFSIFILRLIGVTILRIPGFQ